MDIPYFKAVIAKERIPRTLIAQDWTMLFHSCEMGVAGVSLHVTEDDRVKFIRIYEQGSRSLAYDPHERPVGEPYSVEIGYWSQMLQTYGSEYLHVGMGAWDEIKGKLQMVRGESYGEFVMGGSVRKI